MNLDSVCLILQLDRIDHICTISHKVFLSDPIAYHYNIIIFTVWFMFQVIRGLIPIFQKQSVINIESNNNVHVGTNIALPSDEAATKPELVWHSTFVYKEWLLVDWYMFCISVCIREYGLFPGFRCVISVVVRNSCCWTSFKYSWASYCWWFYWRWPDRPNHMHMIVLW